MCDKKQKKTISLDEEYSQTFKDAEAKYDKYLELNTFNFSEISSQPQTEKSNKEAPNWNRPLGISFK